MYTLHEGENQLNVTLDPIVVPVAALSGYVRSNTGAAIQGALVELVGTAWAMATGALGQFRIDGIVPGSYTIRVSHPDYETREY